MPQSELTQYINQQRQQGINDQQIKQTLITSGWPEATVQEHLTASNEPIPPQPPQANQPAAKSQPKTLLIFGGILIALIITSVIIFLTAQTFFSTPSEPAPRPTIAPLPTATPTTIPTPTTVIEQPTPTPGSSAINIINPDTDIIDCQSDLTCLSQAAATCQPAGALQSTTLDIFGVQQTTVTSLIIQETDEPDSCKLFLTNQKNQLTFPPETPPEIIDQQQQIYKALEGRNGSCIFETTELVRVINKWEQGDLDSGTVKCSGSQCTTEGGDFANAECEGDYFSNQIPQ